MDAVSVNLEADLALIHIAAGAARATPPPGTLALRPPRRAARGRKDDLLFLNLGLHAPQPVSPGFVDQLAHLAADAFFKTAGSVTAALREAAVVVNEQLMDANQRGEDPSHVQGRLLAGVLRGEDFYLAQCGMGQIVVLRQGQVGRMTSDEAANRPLGISVSPFVRFHHFLLEPQDIVLLTTTPAPSWSDPLLAGLSGLEPASAVERLAGAAERDLTGLLLRLVPAGQAAAVPEAIPVEPDMAAAPSDRRPTVPRPRRRTVALDRVWTSLAVVFSPIGRALASAFAWLGDMVTRLVFRLAPGLAEPPRAGAFSPALLAATAVAVPLIVVAVVSVVYLRRGRGEQLEIYLGDAQAALARSQTEEDPITARAALEAGLLSLDAAEDYGPSPEIDALRVELQGSLDGIDRINRVEFQPLVSGGFGRDAQITALAATATDVYALDSANGVLWRAWSTGRGFEIDRTFECLEGVGEGSPIDMPVDLAIQPEPGALGAEGVVAIDGSGSLLYCAPEKRPASGQLTEPDIGWGRLQAIDVFGDRLFILDPVANTVWMYDASGGVFSGTPTLFFAEEVPNLEDAVDLAMAQDELFILHADGKVDRCRRLIETGPDGTSRIRTECVLSVIFEDERPGFPSTDHIPGALPTRIAYSPPPEPSLFFLDVLGNGVYHYSMRMIYQGQYKPKATFPSDITALALGPLNEIFVASGDQVYFAQAGQ